MFLNIIKNYKIGNYKQIKKYEETDMHSDTNAEDKAFVKVFEKV